MDGADTLRGVCSKEFLLINLLDGNPAWIPLQAIGQEEVASDLRSAGLNACMSSWFPTCQGLEKTSNFGKQQLPSHIIKLSFEAYTNLYNLDKYAPASVVPK
jgi:hypothetical protein